MWTLQKNEDCWMLVGLHQSASMLEYYFITDLGIA